MDASILGMDDLGVPELEKVFEFQVPCRDLSKIHVAPFFVYSPQGKVYRAAAAERSDAPLTSLFIAIAGELEYAAKMAASRWAIDANTSYDCMAEDRYDQLLSAMQKIESPNFAVRRVYVTIDPIAMAYEAPVPRIEKAPLTLEAMRPMEPVLTPEERLIAEVRTKAGALNDLFLALGELRTKYPEAWAEIGADIEGVFEQARAKIVTGDRKESYRSNILGARIPRNT